MPWNPCPGTRALGSAPWNRTLEIRTLERSIGARAGGDSGTGTSLSEQPRLKGPVEAWLARLLDDVLARSSTVPARVGAVDVSVAPKLGEARAHLDFGGSGTPDRRAWRELADELARDPALARVVAVPPVLYVTLAPGVLESGLARCAREAPVLPRQTDGPGVVVVFCSPNTNKPLHIGHLRACFLGMSLSRLAEATGASVARSQMLSNFGIHMAQALAMYDGVGSPQSAGVKGDHFVGALYRSFHEAAAHAPDLGCEAEQCRAEEPPCLRCKPGHLLRAMAGGDAQLLAVNERLGEWAIEGLLSTQRSYGTTHDACIRESGVIARAVATLERAVDEGICLRRDDGSTYIPVRSTGEAELTLLRRDGTSLVFSMLLGVYLTRAGMYPGWQVFELTGEQWRAGRTAMYEVLRRIGRGELSDRTEGIFFGMVQARGKVMQSRAGTVVTADDLLERTAERVASWDALPEDVRADPLRRRELAASVVKYHVLRWPRAQGFDFAEDSMWQDATRRLEGVMHALDWAGASGPERAAAPSDRSRPLALLLAREAGVGARALAKRDPAILVRYLDDVVDKTLALARQGSAGEAVGIAVTAVVRRTLALLDVSL